VLVRLSALGWLFCTLVAAGAPANTIEIQLPPGVASETFFARYVLTGGDVGNWIEPRVGVSSYFIDTTVHGRPATGIELVLYSPGCEVQTSDLALSTSINRRYAFVCKPVPNTSIAGQITHPALLRGRDVELEARYVVRFAAADFIVTVPVGKANALPPDGHFNLTVPDLSPGELQVWAIDKATDTAMALLEPVVPDPLRTRMGGLKMQDAYTAEIVFTPCVVDPSLLRDRFGFMPRPESGEPCRLPPAAI